MATTWLYRTVTFTETKKQNGWTFWQPDYEILTNVLNEIMEYANQNGYRVTSMTQVQHQVGLDYKISGVLGGYTDQNANAAGYSHKIHNWGVTIIVFLEK